LATACFSTVFAVAKIIVAQASTVFAVAKIAVAEASAVQAWFAMIFSRVGREFALAFVLSNQ
jgi:hypothetical protein